MAGDRRVPARRRHEAVVQRGGWSCVLTATPEMVSVLRDIEDDFDDGFDGRNLIGDDCRRLSVRMLVVTPEGFGCDLRIPLHPLPSDAVLEAWIGGECDRLVDAFAKGTDADVELRGPFGTKPHRDDPFEGFTDWSPVEHAATSERGRISDLLAMSEGTAGSDVARAVLRWSRVSHPCDGMLKPFLMPSTRSSYLRVAASRPWLFAWAEADRLPHPDKDAFVRTKGILARDDVAGIIRKDPSEPPAKRCWIDFLDRHIHVVDALGSTAEGPAWMSAFRSRIGRTDDPFGFDDEDDDDFAFIMDANLTRHLSTRGMAAACMVLARSVPDDWVPKTWDDASAFVKLATALSASQWFDGQDDLRRLVSSCGGRWHEFVGRFGLDRYGPDPFAGIADMVSHVAATIVAPSIEGRVRGRKTDLLRRRTARALLSPDCGLLELVRKSDRWHRVQDVLPVPMAGRSRSWKALAPDWSRKGTKLVFLTTATALSEEGRTMGHCVGTYDAKCAVGESHIASIRRGKETLSTVELKVESGRPRIVQNLSKGNGPAPRESTAFVNRWIAECSAGRIELDPEAVAVRTPLRAGGWSVPTTGTPADWKDILRRNLTKLDWPALREEVVAEWNRVQGDASVR